MTAPVIGEVAPDIILPIEGGDTIMLRDYKKKNIVLYFYPKDDTPGCTQEAKDFRDNIEEFIKLNTVIFGISKDGIERHEDFKKKYNLPFSLISDEDHTAAMNYGVWVEKNMYGKKYMGMERSTFLLGKQNILKKVWRKVKVDGHVNDVLNEVKSLEAKNLEEMDKKL